MCPRDALTPEHAWLSSSTERLFCFHATIRTAFYYFSLAITSAISEPSIISGHPKMSMMPAQLSRTRACVPLSMAAFRSWVAGAKLGERFEYYRGRLGIDRVKGTSSLREPERRKLNAVADYALALRAWASFICSRSATVRATTRTGRSRELRVDRSNRPRTACLRPVLSTSHAHHLGSFCFESDDLRSRQESVDGHAGGATDRLRNRSQCTALAPAV